MSNANEGDRIAYGGNRTWKPAGWKQKPRHYLILRVRSGDGRIGRIDVRQRDHVIDPEAGANRGLPIAKYVIGESHPGLKVMSCWVALPELFDRHNAARHRCRHDHRWAWSAAWRSRERIDQARAILPVGWDGEHLVSQSHVQGQIPADWPVFLNVTTKELVLDFYGRRCSISQEKTDAQIADEEIL